MISSQAIELKRNQRLKPIELERLQNKKLRAIIKHSYENVPLYHNLLKEANLKPDNIKTTRDLSKIPILTKSMLRNLPLEHLVAKNIDSTALWKHYTSGTSGLPLSVYWERNATIDQYLRNYRFQLKCGDKIRNKQVDIGAGWACHSPCAHAGQRMGLFKTLIIPPLGFTDMQTIIKKIKEFGADTLIAPPSIVRLLGKEIAETDVKGLRIRLVFTGGEMLDDYTRKISQEVFGAKLFDGYGTNELGFISGECEKHIGYHIESDACIVEITRDGESVSPGEEGEITVTSLTHYATPLIRYNLEDIGKLTKSECSCGSFFSLMKITQGRKSDVLKLPNCRVVPAVTIYQPLSPIIGIKQFQLQQEKIDRFAVKIVKDQNFTEKTAEAVKSTLLSKVGEAQVEIYFVDEIPRKTRKFKPFVTQVPVN